MTSCTGTQPSSTQACASGCGTQTRSVTCNNGTWVTGSWTGTCTSPTQTQATSQSCGNGGTQTRTCTASCSGGTCEAWGQCTGQTCDQSTKPAESQTCASGCGTQTRSVTCTNGTWTTGSWTGTCTSPTQTQPTTRACVGVSKYGNETRTCTATCAGGTCGEWNTSACKNCSWQFVSGQMCVDSSDGTERGNTCLNDRPCPSTCNTPGSTITCLLRVAHNATLKCVCN
jgi:hypothetical protein